MSAFAIVYTAPEDGVRLATGAGGHTAIRLEPAWLESLTSEERDVLASQPWHLTDEARLDRAIETARQSKKGWKVSAPTTEALREALQGELVEHRKQQEAKRQRQAEAAASVRAWLNSDRSERPPYVSDLPDELADELRLARQQRDAERDAERQRELRAQLRGLVSEVLAEVEGARDVGAPDLPSCVREGQRLLASGDRVPEGLVPDIVSSMRRIRREIAERRYEIERSEWVFAHGSEHLRALLTEEIECDQTYRAERLAAERPGWVFERSLSWDPDEEDPSDPPVEAVRLLQGARAVDSSARLHAVLLGPETEDDDGADAGFAVRAEFLGEPIWLGLTPE